VTYESEENEPRCECDAREDEGDELVGNLLLRSECVLEFGAGVEDLFVRVNRSGLGPRKNEIEQSDG
jgi:hypothetical protein